MLPVGMGCTYDQQRYFCFAFGCRVGVVGDIFYGKDMSYIMLVVMNACAQQNSIQIYYVQRFRLWKIYEKKMRKELIFMESFLEFIGMLHPDKMHHAMQDGKNNKIYVIVNKNGSHISTQTCTILLAIQLPIWKLKITASKLNLDSLKKKKKKN